LYQRVSVVFWLAFAGTVTEYVLVVPPWARWQDSNAAATSAAWYRFFIEPLLVAQRSNADCVTV
jgi:hypothetical protein